MKYLVVISLFFTLGLYACGGGAKKSSSGGMMMKCGMKMGNMEGMDHDSKDMKHDNSGKKEAVKCGSDMKMDDNDYSEKSVTVH